MANLRLVLLGAPGTGKGTQAARLAKRYDLKPIASGDALRAKIESGNELGRQVEEFVSAGRLVPDEIVTTIMLEAINGLPATQGFLLDGFPRTPAQADALAAGLAGDGRRVDAVLSFEMPSDEIIERLTSRRICSGCKKIYNLRFCPPRQDGVCDVCGEQLMQRMDDHADVVATRLQTYLDLTHPLIEHYLDRGILHRINAAATPDEVEAELAGIIEGLERA